MNTPLGVGRAPSLTHVYPPLPTAQFSLIRSFQAAVTVFKRLAVLGEFSLFKAHVGELTPTLDILYQVVEG